MLYKFKSKAAADLIMLQPNGQRILQIIGKDSSTSQGIILPEQMPMAIAALEAAVAAEDAARKTAKADAAESGDNLPHGEAITLRQRALPFIDMLRRCEKAGKEIVWGV